jgi:hypothetical protein
VSDSSLENLQGMDDNKSNRTRLERRLFLALVIVSSFIVLLITGALTFWTLLVYR